MKKDLIIVIGAYGSGKSEYSVNLAFENRDQDAALVDLDVVNPYFRSREVRDEFAQHGIEVVAPEGSFSHADLPMISPRIRGAIQQEDKLVILDVGGDPNGSRALARFKQEIQERGYQMKLVVNTRRPFTSNVDEILDMARMLETTSGLEIDEFVCNTNLMEFTTGEVITEGVNIVREAAEKKGVAFHEYLALEQNRDIVPETIGNQKRHLLHYYLRKPWEQYETR